MISNNNSTRNMNVLIVDDESTSLSLLTKILEGTYTVHSSQNVDDAINILKTENIAIILSDIHMPGSNGFELLRFTKKEFRDIPLLFVTGVGNKEIAVEALKLGAYDFVEKPLHKQELMFSITRAMEIYEARQKDIETEKFLRLLEAGIESASDAFMMGMIDEENKSCTIEFVNKALSSQVGYPAKDLVGQSPGVFQGEESDPLLIEKLVTSIASGKDYSGETLNYRKNGTVYFSEWQISPIEVAGASKKFWVGMVHDIKQHKLVEEKLRISESEVKSLKGNLNLDKLSNPESFKEIITNDVKMIGLFHYIEAIKKSHLPVLITGEPGVGKDLFARAAYHAFEASGRMIRINCCDLDEGEESKSIFGLPSDSGENGRPDAIIKKAQKGILYLDEVSALSSLHQSKLLRLLQELEYYPIKSDESSEDLFRVIASSSKDLEKLIEAGEFRADLYYKLAHHHIEIPPVRERMDDFEPLVDYFLNQASEAHQKNKPSYPKELLTLLSTYYFPDNISGLRQMIFDAVREHQRGILSMDSFKTAIKHHTTSVTLIKDKGVVSMQKKESLISFSSRLPTLKEVTNELILEALKRSNENQGIAAKILGVSRQALNKRLNRIEDVSAN